MWCYQLGTYQTLGLPTTVFKKIRFHFLKVLLEETGKQ